MKLYKLSWIVSLSRDKNKFYIVPKPNSRPKDISLNCMQQRLSSGTSKRLSSYNIATVIRFIKCLLNSSMDHPSRLLPPQAIIELIFLLIISTCRVHLSIDNRSRCRRHWDRDRISTFKHNTVLLSISEKKTAYCSA